MVDFDPTALQSNNEGPAEAPAPSSESPQGSQAPLPNAPQTVKVWYPDEPDLVDVTPDQLPAVQAYGGRLATPDEVQVSLMKQMQGMPAFRQEAKTFADSLKSVATFGWAETPEEQKQRFIESQAFPGAASAGEMAGTTPGMALGLLAPEGAGAAAIAGRVGIGAAQGTLAGMQIRGANAPDGQKVAAMFDGPSMAEDAAFGGAFAGAFEVATPAVGKLKSTIIPNPSEEVMGHFAERYSQYLAENPTPENIAAQAELARVQQPYADLLQQQEAEQLALKSKVGIRAKLIPESIEPDLQKISDSYASRINSAAEDMWNGIVNAAVKNGSDWAGANEFFQGFLKEGSKSIFNINSLGGYWFMKELLSSSTAGKVWATMKLGRAAYKTFQNLDPALQDVFRFNAYVQMQKVQNFLNGKATGIMKATMPTGIPAFMSATSTPNEEQIDKMGKYYQAATNPPAAIQQMKDGVVYPEHVEALQTLYPNKWGEAQGDLIGDLLKKYKEQGYLSPEDMINFQKLSNTPWSVPYSPYMQQGLQQFYGAPQGQQPQQGGVQGAQQKKQPRSRVLAGQAAKSELADDMMTDGERTSYNSTRRI